jgi:hypothetical protein
MRFLLASSGLGVIAVALSSSAGAATTVSTSTTAPLVTSTAGDIQVTSAGSIKPATGVAITINSNNKVQNDGTLAIQGVNGSAGIVANPGFAGDITNSTTGIITIDENYTPTDTDNDGDIDGPFAQGNNRFGIHVLSGGNYTGNVVNAGTITIEGNQSAGIAIDSALTGSLTSTGTIKVLGDNSVGIRAGAVSGNVTIGNASTTTVQGANAVGVLLGGNIGGALVIQGTVSATGYRNTVPPADTSKLDADDLLQGGSAVVVGGNVAQGILLDTRPAANGSTSTDVDNDGIPDASETTATIVSYGAAAAMVIGSATQSVSVGAVASSTAGHGLVINGSVTGNGVYSGVNGNGLAIGGLGQTVNIAGGMTVNGSIAATANGASATALHIGSGATVPQIAVTGSIGAGGGGTATSAVNAVLIDAGATVNSIANSGSISSSLSSTGGTAAAIVDHSGTLSLIQNSGTIGVANFASLGNSATAIDLSANSTGATIRQVAAASGKPAPQINGNILFGSGNDTLDIQAGTVAGNVNFGGGSDVLNLTGTSVFQGTLANSNGLAVNIGNGSTLNVTTVGAVNIGSLNAGAGSTLAVTIGQSGNTLYNVAGNASFGTGAKVLVTLNQVGTANGSYTIVDAGSLTGSNNLTAVNLPFLFNGTLVSDTTNGTVSLDLQRKTATQLGLNASESAIYNAAISAADADAPIAAAFLGLTDQAGVRGTLQQMLPDHAGGAFEAATKGSRLSAEILADPKPLSGLWLQQVAWGSSKSIGSTSSYDITGWGASGGYGINLGKFATVGVTASYLWGKDGHNSNELQSNHYEGGVYILGGSGPFRAWARATIGTINFDSKRNFSSTLSGQTVSRTADGSWKGTLYSGTAGVSYEAHMGRISIRPNATLEYYKLKEDGYSETGGGDAFDLTVQNRDSKESAANAMLTLGYDLMHADPEGDGGWARIELEGGRRQLLSSTLGNTTAAFKNGTPFTLTPEDRTSGWRGGLRVLGGNSGVKFVGEVNAEQQQGDVSLGARAGVNFDL